MVFIRSEKSDENMTNIGREPSQVSSSETSQGMVQYLRLHPKAKIAMVTFIVTGVVTALFGLVQDILTRYK